MPPTRASVLDAPRPILLEYFRVFTVRVSSLGIAYVFSNRVSYELRKTFFILSAFDLWTSVPFIFAKVSDHSCFLLSNAPFLSDQIE